MITHFVHYLKREIIIRYPKDADNSFFFEFQNPKDGFERPMYHITRRHTGPITRIKVNDVIWLFSTLKSPWGILPPSLDAKFVVKEIEHLDDGKIKFLSKEDSQWFPLADASTIISKLKTTNKWGIIQELQPNYQKSLGLYLQSIRQLNSAEEIVQWNKAIQNSEVNFISYRIKDGTKSAFQKVKSLIQEGKVIFWDRFSLPRRLAERRELVDDEALNSYLMKNIGKSSCVWGIESAKYAEPKSYSWKEAQAAKEQGKYIPVEI